MSLRIRFRFDGKCSLHPRYDPARAMDGHNMEIVKGVNLCTSFIFTRRSRREGLRTRMASWSKLRAVAKNSAPLTSPASFQTPKTNDGFRCPARIHSRLLI